MHVIKRQAQHNAHHLGYIHKCDFMTILSFDLDEYLLHFSVSWS